MSDVLEPGSRSHTRTFRSIGAARRSLRPRAPQLSRRHSAESSLPGDDDPGGPPLGELRRRIAISIVAVRAGGGRRLHPRAEQIIQLLLTPLPGGEVVFLSLSGGFMVYLRVAIIVGILARALPVILYQTWAFVAPGPDAASERQARRCRGSR